MVAKIPCVRCGKPHPKARNRRQPKTELCHQCSATQNGHSSKGKKQHTYVTNWRKAKCQQ